MLLNAVFRLEDAGERQASHLSDGPPSNRLQLHQTLPSPWQLLPSDISQFCSGWQGELALLGVQQEALLCDFLKLIPFTKSELMYFFLIVFIFPPSEIICCLERPSIISSQVSIVLPTVNIYSTRILT